MRIVALLLCWLLLAAPAEQLAATGAALSGQWSTGGYTVAWSAPARACLMIADSPSGPRYLLACAAAGEGTLRYTGIDINYQPRPGRALLLVDAEQIAGPPLAALEIGPGPHTVALPVVAR